MPQNENLSVEWRKALGDDWKRIHETYLHTLGNLTLTGYNAEYSDRPFLEKRDMRGGFAQSPLKLNQGLGSLSTWNEQTIKDRAKRLAETAVGVWDAPKLDTSILDAYRLTPEASGYSIDDHPHLAGGPMRELFDAFREQVLVIDSAVVEEFLKLYVAYKAETNFVDVVPQPNRLLLSLNMRFHDIDDPRGLCRDVTGLGRWGNGDVEVTLDSTDQLPYAMALVRQSFERQMGNGEAI